jgi:hypothetical protein
MSAQKLSNPNEDPVFDKRIFNSQTGCLSYLVALNTKNINNSSDTNNNKLINNNNKISSDWREIVKKRIEAKTVYKRKHLANDKTQKKHKENTYSECYGYFFFPLLHPYDA